MSITPSPAASPTAKRGGARTLAVTSGKGGVGKTFVTANLAAALAAQGQRFCWLARNGCLYAGKRDGNDCAPTPATRAASKSEEKEKSGR